MIRTWGDTCDTYERYLETYERSNPMTGAPSDTGFIAIYSTRYAFAALHSTGTIQSWGVLGAYPKIQISGTPTGSGFTAIYSTERAFAALDEVGSIHTWGDYPRGGSGAPSGSGYVDIISSGGRLLRDKSSEIHEWDLISENLAAGITITVTTGKRHSTGGAPSGTGFRKVEALSYTETTRPGSCPPKLRMAQPKSDFGCSEVNLEGLPLPGRQDHDDPMKQAPPPTMIAIPAGVTVTEVRLCYHG